jgi:hypothetical protein
MSAEEAAVIRLCDELSQERDEASEPVDDWETPPSGRSAAAKVAGRATAASSYVCLVDDAGGATRRRRDCSTR